MVVTDGRISSVGRRAEVEIPADAIVIEEPDGWIVPGFVDLHSHVSGSDLNDMILLINPDLRVLDQRTADELGLLTIASDLCERDVVSVFPDDTLADALARMDHHGFRQLPVVDRADPVMSTADTWLG